MNQELVDPVSCNLDGHASVRPSGIPDHSINVRSPIEAVFHGKNGLVRCTPSGVCPPDVTGLRCRFPGGDAPDSVRCEDGSVVCRPPAKGSSQAFSVEASGSDGALLHLGDGVLEPSVEGMRAFASMSMCYLLFTTTDGALRMVVLFHAFTLGFSAWEVAIMLSLYEAAGVFTNLAAGMAGARWGIRQTLLMGLCVQLVGIALLYGFDINWGDGVDARWKAVWYVSGAASLGGVAKDLVKLGGKTVSKLVTPAEKESRLFAIVAWITGMKNSMKGVGYFVGAASLSVSFHFALGINLALILLALPIGILGLNADVGKARSKNLSLATILTPAANVRALSLARAFLFGSRDLWFEVVLPFYLRDATEGLGWSREITGTFLACFIILYGQIQSATPRVLLKPLRQEPANKLVQVLWNSILTAICALLASVFITAGQEEVSRNGGGSVRSQRTLTLCLLLALFCLVFAVNSSVHSYLIVRYSAGDKVAADVGFYYMSNALGRFVGTLVSGALYQWSAGENKTGAMGWCFAASTLFSLASTVLTMRIDDQAAGLACSTWNCVHSTESMRDGGGASNKSSVTAPVGGE